MFLFSFYPFERYAQNASIKTAQSMNKVSGKKNASYQQTNKHTRTTGGIEDEVKN